MIKAMFFDYDGVLTRDESGSLTTIRYLSEETGLPYERIREVLQKHNDGMNRGATTYSEIWPEVCATLGANIPLSLLLGAFESTPINEEMLAFARELKNNYAVGIITDNKKERIDHLKRYQRLEEVFAPIVVSAEVGTTKAGAAIFQYALGCLGVRPEESVFIDNSRSNLIAPVALGMKAVYFDGEKNDVSELVRYLGAQFGISRFGAA